MFVECVNLDQRLVQAGAVHPFDREVEVNRCAGIEVHGFRSHTNHLFVVMFLFEISLTCESMVARTTLAIGVRVPLPAPDRVEKWS